MNDSYNKYKAHKLKMTLHFVRGLSKMHCLQTRNRGWENKSRRIQRYEKRDVLFPSPLGLLQGYHPQPLGGRHVNTHSIYDGILSWKGRFRSFSCPLLWTVCLYVSPMSLLGGRLALQDHQYCRSQKYSLGITHMSIRNCKFTASVACKSLLAVQYILRMHTQIESGPYKGHFNEI